MFTGPPGSRDTHSGRPPFPRALWNLQQAPGNLTPGYNGTFSQMFQVSLLGVTLLTEKKRNMKRSDFKFICRVVFPFGRKCSIWASAPLSMVRANGSVSLFQKKTEGKLRRGDEKWGEWSEAGTRAERWQLREIRPN